MKMKYTELLLAAVLFSSVMVGCKSEYEALLEGPDLEAKYAAAFDYFNQGKYAKAGQLFESLASVGTGTDRDDTVYYYWGLSNYRFKDYYTAETNFTNYLNVYPRSAFSQEASYYRIDCLYRETLRYELDQKPTYAAINAIGEYLSDFPDTPYRLMCDNMLTDLNERLDRKAFENARLYFKMEDYKAATVAFKNVLKDDSDNIYREDILYYIAQSSYKYASLSYPEKQKERFLVFVDDYLNFIGEFADSAYRRELDGMYRRVQRFLGKNPDAIPAVEGAESEDQI